MAETQKSPSLLEGIVTDVVRSWEQLPNKVLFFTLLGAWLLLFQFLGNATFGYVDTSSLFGWMLNAYKDDIDGSGDGHGKIIPFVVLGLFWWKRDKILAAPNRTWWPGLLLLVVALALHIIGYLIQQPRVSIVALFTGIYALIGLAWGPAWLRVSFFPFFLFAFCVPISSISLVITFPLRVLVAKLVVMICNPILGMHVIREGTALTNSLGTYGYDVAAACSGLRSFIAILALSTIFGFVTFEKNWKRGVMILSAFPLAVAGNVLRMMGIILAAEVSGQKAGDFVHENAIISLLPYLPAIAGVMLLGRWLREPEAEPELALSPKPI
jgi:exosortase